MSNQTKFKIAFLVGCVVLSLLINVVKLYVEPMFSPHSSIETNAFESTIHIE